MAVLFRQCSVIYEMYPLLVRILLTHDDVIWCDHHTMACNIPTITVVCQALIDHYLLRFVVCCSIAFAVVDNGFFMDFVSAL